METKGKAVEAQGAETKKKQKKSVTYALRAIAEHVRTLEGEGLVTKEEQKAIGEIMLGAGSKYLKGAWMEGIAE